MDDEALPQLTENDFTERKGVNKVAECVTDARCIWRELSFRDVGIDGHIEHVNEERQATGRLVLVQVKTGVSYFATGTADYVPFSPPARHSSYWERAPLPVILVMHDPSTLETIWVDARRELRSGRGSPIRVPRRQVFDRHGVADSLATDGPVPVGIEGPEAIVDSLITNRHDNTRFPLTFFDLFVNGLTDIGMSLSFGMDIASEISLARVARDQIGWNEIADPEFEFLDRYVEFVVAHDLARLNFDWWVRLRDNQHMVATMHSPLTTRGQAVVKAIVDAGGQGTVRERFVQMVWQEGEVLDRLDAIDQFVDERDSSGHET